MLGIKLLGKKNSQCLLTCCTQEFKKFDDANVDLLSLDRNIKDNKKEAFTNLGKI